ncbi:MAG: hypothetical protein R3C42_00710 [Parvularculaceae bacterium]|nr:hypothetical protein [Parvularculaceae bacterium]
MRSILIVSVFWALAACATAVGTAYGPADAKGYGYEETRIETNRYRISFAGDGATPMAVVEDYALLRAAELAIDNGFDWFRIIGRSMDEQEKGGVGLGAGVGGGGRNVGVGVGGNLGNIGARKFYTARLEVLFGSGEKPADEAGGEIYDARSVIETIRARIDGAPAQ